MGPAALEVSGLHLGAGFALCAGCWFAARVGVITSVGNIVVVIMKRFSGGSGVVAAGIQKEGRLWFVLFCVETFLVRGGDVFG